MKKLTNNEFIERANIIHNKKYLYDNVEYISSSKKVKIICKEHGEFEQEANSHLSGKGCSTCAGNIKSNIKDFIKKSNLVHKNKYDYSLVNYNNAKDKVIIICKEHGPFEQIPNNHLNSHGCNKCGCIETNKKNTNNIEFFIEKSNIIHQYKYDYSLVEYTGAKNKVKIICKEHGEFNQSPSSHINGHGCRKCFNEKNMKRMTKTLEEFLIDAIKIHGDKYDYSLVEYKGTDNKVKIVCKEHGIFNQKCSKHLQNQGCPTCVESKLEKEIRLLLISNNIEYKQQYGNKYDDFYLQGQRLDFYLPDYNLGIECQGEQHFSPVDFGNKGEEYTLNAFKNNISRDLKKYLKCKKNGVEIVYYCNKSNLVNGEYIGEIYCEFDDILKKMKKINEK